MGSYWSLHAGRRSLALGKNYVSDSIAMLFTSDELTVEWTEVAEDDGEEIYDGPRRPRDIFVYRSTVRDVRDRLVLQGFDPDVIYQAALDYVRDQWSDPDAFLPYSVDEVRTTFDTPETFLAALIEWAWIHDWQAPDTPMRRSLDDGFADLLESFDEPRFAVSLLIRGARSNAAVILDLSDCLMGGYLDPKERPHLTAQARLDGGVGSGGAVIVVTEGSSDARLLQRALQLAQPGIAHMFTFMDFASTSAAGGVEQAVKLTKSLAAAGVLNRVICVLDNDGAGQDGAATLAASTLPDRFSVRLLPDVSYARRYPVQGPDEGAVADVNGKAVAIEMTFGEEVLRAGGRGELPPVAWHQPVGKKAYPQGSISHKRDVEASIRRALRTASDLSDLDPGTAKGCQRVARMLVEAAKTAKPSYSSERSPLLAERLDVAAAASAS